MDETTPIKDLRPRMRGVYVQGTVGQLLPEETPPIASQGRHWRTASFVIQDDSGHVRVVLMGNISDLVFSGRITVGRPVKLRWISVRKGRDGQPEIVVRRYMGIELLPTAEEEERIRRLTCRGPGGPTQWLTQEQRPELYQKMPITLQVPRGLVEFARDLAAQEGLPVEDFLVRVLGREIHWEYYPPEQ